MVKRRRTTAKRIFDCDSCKKTFKRQAELSRHMKTHSVNKEDLAFCCPFLAYGCDHKALQKSNLKTHLNVHFRIRPNECPEPGCEFACADPASLTHHRITQHNYVPKGSSSESSSSMARRKTARQRHRYTPYSYSSDGSATSSDPGTPSSYISLVDDLIKECKQNASVTYCAALLAKFGVFGDPRSVPDLQTEDVLPLDSGSLAVFKAEIQQPSDPTQRRSYGMAVQPVCRTTTVGNEVFNDPFSKLDDWQSQPSSLLDAEAHATGYLQLLMPTPWSHCVAGAPIQPTCDMAITEEVFSNFLSKFGDWQPEPLPSQIPVATYGAFDVPVSSQANFHSRAVNDTAMTTPAVPPPFEDQCSSSGILLPMPASLPPSEVQYPLYNSPYEYNDCPIEAVSFGTQVPQVDSFTTADTGFYHEAVYPQNVCANYFYDTYAGADDVAAQGLCMDQTRSIF